MFFFNSQDVGLFVYLLMLLDVAEMHITRRTLMAM